MNDEREIEVLLEQAARSRALSNWPHAVQLGQRALTIDPDHARAHASLAFSLLGAKRLTGAAIEAGLALASDGNDAYCHYAAAAVMRAERKLDAAWDHCLVALQIEHVDPDIHVLGATIRRLRGEDTAARELLQEALEHAPDHVDALTELARLELETGHVDEAQRRIDEALLADPSDADAHVVAGLVALHRGDVSKAEEHARFVLNENANHHGALVLWTQIKARRSPLLGLWWRWTSMLVLRSDRAQVGILIGSFIVMELLQIAATALGFETIAMVLDRAWLVFCVYTWVAPGIFRWMLQNDLGTVKLRDDF